jgi:hypothetical protein
VTFAPIVTLFVAVELIVKLTVIFVEPAIAMEGVKVIVTGEDVIVELFEYMPLGEVPLEIVIPVKFPAEAVPVRAIVILLNVPAVETLKIKAVTFVPFAADEGATL